MNVLSTILLTGGAGFIGSNLVHLLLGQGYTVINLDKLTYAGNLDSLVDVQENPLYTFIEGDICDSTLVARLFTQYCPASVMHLAAESHVDRSIDGPAVFVETNVKGTFCLLDAARTYYHSLEESCKRKFRFVHISTDEVYGSLGEDGLFSEETPCAPNSPYSASKAASDHLVRAYFHTYGLPTIITNCSNNYGPYQFPEKLIPLVILNALEGKALPIYGDGTNVRDWLYVEDHCRALELVLKQGIPGEKYNIGGHNEQANLEIVRIICQLLDREKPKPDGTSYLDLIRFVEDRPGHDRRYAIDAGKIARELGWMPQETFQTGIEKTVRWYLANLQWSQRVTDGSYRRERLGKGV